MSAVVVAEILGPDMLVILAIVALLFGGTQIPKLARSLGQASREFRDGVSGDGEDRPHEDEKVTMTRAELDALMTSPPPPVVNPAPDQRLSSSPQEEPPGMTTT